MVYQPSKEILEKYADVLVNFALNSGKGIKKGEKVFIQVPECAKPLLIVLRRAVLKAGGFPLIQYIPDDFSREFFELANDEQLDFFPQSLLKGRVEEMDHLISIIADKDMKELEGIQGEKIMRNQKAFKPYFEWRDEKENQGKFTWTLALYGTEAMAKEAGMSLEEYWTEIIRACFLDLDNPKEKWQSIFVELERIKNELNKLEIEKIHVKSENIDLTIGIGKNRKWMGGSGRNIPSFELFISPDCRIADGKIKFTEPLYRYGNLINGVSLEFKNGEIVKAEAVEGEEILKSMIETDPGSKRIGEFSLTDKRMSRIMRFMAETLFDENVGGEYGNCHIAIGKAYQDSYPGDVTKITKDQWKEMGYNDSAVHTDIVTREDRVATAFLVNGENKVIYQNGKFVV